MEFNHLVGKIALGTAYPADYTDWAMNILENGSDSENIAILAGLGLEKNPDSEEVKNYFYKSLGDLGVELPTEENSILSYAKYICSEIVGGNIPPKKGLSILDGFYSKSDYEPIYSIWDELSEDIWLVDDGEGSIFNTGLSKDNVERYIINIAKQFIKLTEIELPNNFFGLHACTNCGYIGEHKLKRYDKSWMPEIIYKIVYNKMPAMCGTCAKCGKRFPLGMSDYEGREKYLDKKC